MITPKLLAESYALNLRLLQMQTDGLTDEDCLVESPYNINTLNWVLGHIAVNRDNVLVLLGEEPVLDEASTGRYQRGSEPVTGSDAGVLTLSELLGALAAGQERINSAVSKLGEDDLAREVPVGEGTMPLGQRLFGFYFHDTYHTGQTDLLRQVAGANDQVLS